jgi:rod shape-determining protein MreB
LEKTPEKINAKRPLKMELIADSRITEALLKYFFNKALGKSRFFKPDVVIVFLQGLQQRAEGCNKGCK